MANSSLVTISKENQIWLADNNSGECRRKIQWGGKLNLISPKIDDFENKHHFLNT